MKSAERSSVSGDYTYHPMHMHLHSCYQPGGSMEGHIYNAVALGMKYIRFTDHDTRTGPPKSPITEYDFSCGTLMQEAEDGTPYGWRPGEGDRPAPDYTFTAKGLTVTCAAGESRGSTWRTLQTMEFVSGSARHTVSLLAGVCLRLGVAFTPTADTRLVIAIRLSQRPPEHIPAQLWYVLGEPPAELPPHCQCVPLAGDGELTVDFSAEPAMEELGGPDNVFDTVTLILQARHGAGGTYGLSHFSIAVQEGFDPVVRHQQAVADAIGARYGVKPFVTTEISGAGLHKNVFSTAVPVVDYRERGYQVTAAEAIAHVQRHGGIFAYNHPFFSYKKQAFTPEERQQVIARLAAELTASKALGATLIEIGFPRGRHGFSQEDYLRLWDMLSLAGVFLTGYGASDSHNNTSGWFGGSNNFAAWVAAKSQEFPAPEEEFIASMKTGRMYTGDPTRLCGGLRFTAEAGVEMGSVFTCIGKGEPLKLFFSADVAENWRVCTVTDGEREEFPPTVAGEFRHSFLLKSRRPVSFARVELYDESGRCVALTNPIYYVRTDEFVGEIPACRLAERKEAK